MNQVRSWLSGKKTYLVAASAIVAAVIAYADGATDTWQTVTAIFGALLACTIRNGVTTEGAKVVDGLEQQ
jgi:hypothetical protein